MESQLGRRYTAELYVHEMVKKERITGMTRSEQNTVIMFATQRDYTM